jgi:hypothetical protein
MNSSVVTSSCRKLLDVLVKFPGMAARKNRHARQLYLLGRRITETLYSNPNSNSPATVTLADDPPLKGDFENVVECNPRSLFRYSTRHR